MGPEEKIDWHPGEAILASQGLNFPAALEVLSVELPKKNPHDMGN
jgi:hypothetical protein